MSVMSIVAAIEFEDASCRVGFGVIVVCGDSVNCFDVDFGFDGTGRPHCG